MLETPKPIIEKQKVSGGPNSATSYTFGRFKTDIPCESQQFNTGIWRFTNHIKPCTHLIPCPDLNSDYIVLLYQRLLEIIEILAENNILFFIYYFKPYLSGNLTINSTLKYL